MLTLREKRSEVGIPGCRGVDGIAVIRHREDRNHSIKIMVMRCTDYF